MINQGWNLKNQLRNFASLDQRKNTNNVYIYIYIFYKNDLCFIDTSMLEYQGEKRGGGGGSKIKS